MIRFNHNPLNVYKVVIGTEPEATRAEQIVSYIANKIYTEDTIKPSTVYVATLDISSISKSSEYDLFANKSTCSDVIDNDIILVDLDPAKYTDEQIDLIATDLIDHECYYDITDYINLNDDYNGRCLVYTGTMVGSDFSQIIEDNMKELERDEMTKYKYYVTYSYKSKEEPEVIQMGCLVIAADNKIETGGDINLIADRIAAEYPDFIKESIFIIAFSFMSEVETDESEETYVYKITYKTSTDDYKLETEGTLTLDTPIKDLTVSEINAIAKYELDLPEGVEITVVSAELLGSGASSEEPEEDDAQEVNLEEFLKLEGATYDYDDEEGIYQYYSDKDWKQYKIKKDTILEYLAEKDAKEKEAEENVDVDNVAVYKIEYFDSTDNFSTHKVAKITSLVDLYNLEDKSILVEVVRQYVDLPEDTEIRIADVSVLGRGEGSVRRYAKPDSTN